MNKKEIFQEIIKNFQEISFKGIKSRELILPLDSGKIITVSGVRRSGKTYLLLDAVQRLVKKAGNFKQIVFINFEDERLEIGKNDLDLIIRAYQELYPEQDISKVYFFFDEIQNIEGWEKFTRRIYDSVSKHIFITGSNAKFLSKDISTTLRGRSLNYEMYPLSFSEFLKFSKVSADIHSSKNRAKIAAKSKDYLSNGGFPELLSLEKTFLLKTLQEYFDVMLFRDIIERYKRKTHAHLLKYFIKRLLSSISTPVSIHKIYNELKSQGYKIDKNLLYELIEELNSIYLFFPLRK
ncbi:MAG: ATP-binding protein [Elusimicrobia bacterium]|nr:ATP-binding protein [Elusimicrobiota bacterium]